MVKVIINADDFGLSPSVNQAIIDVFKAGNLTSTTIMVNTPGFEDAIRLAKKNPTLGIGLHFCLTEGKPISSPKTLIDNNGNFYSRSTLIKLMLKGKIDYKEVKAEFDAQLAKLQKTKIKITHTDSHQHIMMVPTIFKTVIPSIGKAKLPVRIVEPINYGFGLFIKRPKKAILQLTNKVFAKLNRRKCDKYQITNQTLISVHELDSTSSFLQKDYLELIKSCSDVNNVELMVHPFNPHSDLEDWYKSDYKNKLPFFNICANEYNELTKEQLFSDSQLITFKDLT